MKFQIKDMRVVENVTTVNMWENHNICLSNSNGKYVLYLHADDYLLENALIKLNNKLQERGCPEKAVFWGHSMLNDWTDRIKRFGWNLNEQIVGAHAYKIFVDGGLCPSGVCFSRESFERLGGFINDKNYVFPNSDSITMILLALNSFSFEMFNELIFIRKFSSSKKLNDKTKSEQKKIKKEYPLLLADSFNEGELVRIATASATLGSYVMAYYISLISLDYLRLLRKLIMIRILKNPIYSVAKLFRIKYYKNLFYRIILRI